MLQWIKQLFTTQEYNQASIRMMDTMGDRGSNRPPFNYQAAVRGYRSWVYAAAHINATAVAATPLRLFIRSKSETKSMWRTRPISKSRRAYMYGDLPGDVSPSRKVMTKVMDLGDERHTRSSRSCRKRMAFTTASTLRCCARSIKS